MVETEYDRIAKQAQAQIYEDASVLSFVKEHKKVQNTLYQEYDDFPNSKKQEIVQVALCTTNQIILDISYRVRPTSNWRTKFNAFLTLIWIG
jgi:flagellar biosynthesis/type III secretory pathway protein FliH